MADELPPEQRASYAAMIDAILANADLNTISAKAIRQGMQRKIDYDLAPQKAPIHALIMERFDRIQRDSDGPAHGAGSEPVAEPAPMANGTSHAGTDATKARPDDLTWKKRKVDEREDEDESMSELDDAPASKKVKNGSKIKRGADSDEAYAAKLQAEYDAQARSTRGGRTTKKKTVKKEKKHKKKSSVRVGADDDSEMEGPDGDKPVREKKGGFHKTMVLSEPLSAMLGEPALSRPQTVKKIWEYVKQRDLQDPSDKRQIRCDDGMRAVFKQDKVHMFTMNKLLASHLHPQDE